VVNAEGTELTTIKAPGDRTGLPAWSPDGKQLAFSSGDVTLNLYVTDLAGGTPRKINPPKTSGAGAFWLPDGKTIGYTVTQRGSARSRIVLVRLDGSGEMTVAESDSLVITGANALSPDGRKLLFVLIDPLMKASLHYRELGSPVESVLAEWDEGLVSLASLPLPAWSPDGNFVLLPMRTPKGSGLFRISLDGKEKTRLTPEGTDALAGSWTAPR
jgi:TolB protein